MSNLIASQVSVTTGDIAKAAFGAAKQQMATKIGTINAECEALKKQLEQKFVAYVTPLVADIQSLPVFEDLQKCAAVLRTHDAGYHYSAEIESEQSGGWFDYKEDQAFIKLFKMWFYHYVSTGYADHKLHIRDTNGGTQTLEFSIALYREELSDGGEHYSILQIPARDIPLNEFITANMDIIENIVNLHNKGIDLACKLNGVPDPTTKLTLEEEITNAITLQAVTTMPEIATVFNTTALAGTVIGGYIK
jgi:hypothetical protein